MMLSTTLAHLVLAASLLLPGAIAWICCQPACVELLCQECYWLQGSECGEMALCDQCDDLMPLSFSQQAEQHATEDDGYEGNARV